MTSPRATHIAASAAYVALALTVAGVVMAPQGVPGIGLSGGRLDTVAQKTAGSTPNRPAPDINKHVTGTATPSQQDGTESLTPDAARRPVSSGPAAAACVEKGDCRAADVLAQLVHPGFPGVPVTAPEASSSTSPQDGVPTDAETGASPDAAATGDQSAPPTDGSDGSTTVPVGPTNPTDTATPTTPDPSEQSDPNGQSDPAPEIANEATATPTGDAAGATQEGTVDPAPAGE